MSFNRLFDPLGFDADVALRDGCAAVLQKALDKRNVEAVVLVDASFVFALRCSGMDSFEPVIAYLLGAFCIRNCGGVFEDPQSGRYYDDAEELEREIVSAVDVLLAEAEKGNLRTHPFEGWI